MAETVDQTLFRGERAKLGAGRVSALMAPILLIWAIVAGTRAVAFGGAALDGSLRGNDDYMRMVQVRDLLDGADWTDLVQRRLDPPEGTAMHWSRLPDLPIAGVIVLMSPIVGTATAEGLAAIVVPALTMLMVMAATGAAASVVGGRSSGVTAAFLVAIAFPILGQMAPGRIDHHGWQLVAAALLALPMLRLAKSPERWGQGVLAGVVGALALWVGGEALPWLAAFNAVLALRWWFTGRGLKAGLAFGVTLTVGVAAILPVGNTSTLTVDALCDGLSLASLGTAAAVLAFWIIAGATAWARPGWPLRTVGVALGTVAGVLIVVSVSPTCLAGPFAGLDPALRDRWLVNVSEMQPLWDRLMALRAFALSIVHIAILGVAAVAIGAFRSGRPVDWLWVALGLHVAVGILGGFFAIRLSGYVAIYAAIALAPLFTRLWDRLDPLKLVPRVFARAGLALAVSPVVPMVVFLVLNSEDADAEAAGECDLTPLAALTVDGEPGLIAAPIDLGPDILFRTPHAALAAPYHRNNAGNLDAMGILENADMEAVQALMRRRGVDWIVLCEPAEPYALPTDPSEHWLLRRLAAGEPPPWLVRMVLPTEDGLAVYRTVDAAASGTDDH